MKKKKLSKNAKPVDDEQNPVAENMKKTPPPPVISSSATPKKLKCGSEIDEIFAGKKRKKPEKVEDVVGEPKKEAMKNNKRKDSKVGKENGSTGGLRCRKRTGDGLVIYSEEELGIGRADAGGTPLCPFDCDCCF
ncbi:PREDICTED: uncharacterized protein C6G9.01c-like [Ipomoea nil]|uniref:uncharacterized protein C6G9.01c-like n=1 Tax=Ipomoea nil TaxID=35883 RepID=UPI000900C8CC|nr:PREDICTED: uncharacterized protein C6G9.01c-like [Ipomoea nil]XP_019192530.1 PREDICTED: uncharacterized protein C6G9.01c-like [Ipomoea nil]